jgi:hypothetical protein
MANSHYPLSEIKRLIEEGKYLVTKKAEEAALAEFEFSRPQMINTVLRLNERDCDKTMLSENRPGMWQDVYKPLISANNKAIRAYIKVQIVSHKGDKAVIISFKKA